MPHPTQQLFRQAKQSQQKGDLNQAWLAYKAVLRKQPNHAPTLLAMANILYRQKNYKKAIEIYEHLLFSKPINADLWYRCGMAYFKLADDQAISCFRKVLKLHSPSDTKVLLIAQLQLAKALKRAGKTAEAKKIGIKLVQQNPKNVSVLSFLGELAQEEKEEEEAYQYFQQVTQLVPTNGVGFLNLGAISIVLDQIEEAIIHLKRALALNPNLIQAYRELALCYQNKGEGVQALNYLKKALQLAPQDKENYQRLTDYYRIQGNHKKSIQYGKRHLALDPNNREAQYSLGLSFSMLGYQEGSLPYFKKSYELEPNAPTAYAIGNVYNSLKDSATAKYWYEKVLAHDPNYYAAIYGLLFQKMDNCEWANRRAEEAQLITTLSEQLESDQYGQQIPALYFNYFDLPMPLHLKMSRYLGNGGKKVIEILKKQAHFVHKKQEKKQLHIGYISPDLRDHPVGRLVANLFQYHDRSKVKVTAYFLTPYNDKDQYAKQIVTSSDAYRDFSFTDTVTAAQQIYADGVDILIDLAGHTANQRLPILALQPAPIQAHLMGYPDTTGQEYIQYYLADAYLVPKSLQPFYSEQIWHLPNAFVGTKTTLIDKVITKAELGLPEEGFVFVGFNRAAKIEPELFQCWLNILKAVENSVLWLSELHPTAQINLLQYAERAGISKDRLIFSIKQPYEIYLKSYELADLFLDTWHYSAGSTAIAALGAGLPVLTCMAETNASRMGACIVAAAGLQELICNSLADYEATAIKLATNPRLIQSYKKRLEEIGDQSLLFDNQKFASNLETAFFQMYHNQ